MCRSGTNLRYLTPIPAACRIVRRRFNIGVPFAISLRVDPWSRSAHQALVHFFQRVVEFIRAGNLVSFSAIEESRMRRDLGCPQADRAGRVLGISKPRISSKPDAV